MEGVMPKYPAITDATTIRRMVTHTNIHIFFCLVLEKKKNITKYDSNWYYKWFWNCTQEIIFVVVDDNNTTLFFNTICLYIIDNIYRRLGDIFLNNNDREQYTETRFAVGLRYVLNSKSCFL